jgi:hypothetical protein
MRAAAVFISAAEFGVACRYRNSMALGEAMRRILSPALTVS